MSRDSDDGGRGGRGGWLCGCFPCFRRSTAAVGSGGSGSRPRHGGGGSGGLAGRVKSPAAPEPVPRARSSGGVDEAGSPRGGDWAARSPSADFHRRHPPAPPSPRPSSTTQPHPNHHLLPPHLRALPPRPPLSLASPSIAASDGAPGSPSSPPFIEPLPGGSSPMHPSHSHPHGGGNHFGGYGGSLPATVRRPGPGGPIDAPSRLRELQELHRMRATTPGPLGALAGPDSGPNSWQQLPDSFSAGASQGPGFRRPPLPPLGAGGGPGRPAPHAHLHSSPTGPDSPLLPGRAVRPESPAVDIPGSLPSLTGLNPPLGLGAAPVVPSRFAPGGAAEGGGGGPPGSVGDGRGSRGSNPRRSHNGDGLAAAAGLHGPGGASLGPSTSRGAYYGGAGYNSASASSPHAPGLGGPTGSGPGLGLGLGLTAGAAGRPPPSKQASVASVGSGGGRGGEDSGGEAAGASGPLSNRRLDRLSSGAAGLGLGLGLHGMSSPSHAVGLPGALHQSGSSGRGSNDGAGQGRGGLAGVGVANGLHPHQLGSPGRGMQSSQGFGASLTLGPGFLGPGGLLAGAGAGPAPGAPADAAPNGASLRSSQRQPLSATFPLASSLERERERERSSQERGDRERPSTGGAPAHAAAPAAAAAGAGAGADARPSTPAAAALKGAAAANEAMLQALLSGGGRGGGGGGGKGLDMSKGTAAELERFDRVSDAMSRLDNLFQPLAVGGGGGRNGSTPSAAHPAAPLGGPPPPAVGHMPRLLSSRAGAREDAEADFAGTPPAPANPELQVRPW